ESTWGSAWVRHCRRSTAARPATSFAALPPGPIRGTTTISSNPVPSARAGPSKLAPIGVAHHSNGVDALSHHWNGVPHQLDRGGSQVGLALHSGGSRYSLRTRSNAWRNAADQE